MNIKKSSGSDSAKAEELNNQSQQENNKTVEVTELLSKPVSSPADDLKEIEELLKGCGETIWFYMVDTEGLNNGFIKCGYKHYKYDYLKYICSKCRQKILSICERYKDVEVGCDIPLKENGEIETKESIVYPFANCGRFANSILCPNCKAIKKIKNISEGLQ